MTFISQNKWDTKMFDIRSQNYEMAIIMRHKCDLLCHWEYFFIYQYFTSVLTMSDGKIQSDSVINQLSSRVLQACGINVPPPSHVNKVLIVYKLSSRVLFCVLGWRVSPEERQGSESSSGCSGELKKPTFTFTLSVWFI